MKRFAIFITGVLVIAISSWPSLADDGDRFLIGGKPLPDVVAKINGSAVPGDILENEVKAWRIMADRRGTPKSAEEEIRFAKREINRAIDHELLYQKSQEIKIRIPSNTIQKEIEALQQKFPNRKMFLSAMAFQRLTLEKLAARIEKRLAEEEFVRKKLAPAVQVSDGMVEAYYQKNKNRFRSSAKYLVSHIFVATVSSGEEVPTDSINRKKALRMIRMINGQAKVKIQSLGNRLKKGEDFSALCKAYSEDDATKDKAGSMGEIELSQTIPSLASAILELKPGEISGVVESPYGYHILKLDGKTPDEQISLKDSRSDILNVLLKKELERKREEYLSDLRKVADIKTFF